MYQNETMQTEDEIVIDIDGLLNKIKCYIHKKSLVLIVVVIMVCGLFVGGRYYLHNKIYQSYITYMVNYVGDEGTDAFVTAMLGSDSDTAFIYGGLKEQLCHSIEKNGLDSNWLKKNSLETHFDSSTNLLTVYGVANSIEQMEALHTAIAEVFPGYATHRFNDITLIVIDENMEPDAVNELSMGETVAIGILLGIFAASMMIAVSLFRNQMIYTKEDMKKITHIDYVGEIPRVEKKKSLQNNTEETLSILKINKRNQSFAESIRSLRYKVVKKMEREEDKVLLVISSVSGEGKTTVSTNLAITMAESGKRVVLLDGDIYCANIKKNLQLTKIKATLCDYLQGKASTEDLIVKGLPMDVIAGEPGKNISSLGSVQGKMAELIEELRQLYDYVIIDTAPTVIRSDAEILSTMADAFVYVVSCDHTDKNAIQRGLAALVNKPIHCLGYILNLVDSYSGSYHGKYYKYYQENK